MTMRMRIDASSPGECVDHELREFPRVVVQEEGMVRLPGSSVAIPCIIENISLSGAKLDFGQSMVLPSKIELEIGPRYRVECRLVWLRGTKAGVRFVK